MNWIRNAFRRADVGVATVLGVVVGAGNMAAAAQGADISGMPQSWQGAFGFGLLAIVSLGRYGQAIAEKRRETQGEHDPFRTLEELEGD